MSRKNYHQSVFVPTNPSKYVGSKAIKCRSSWEKKMCTFLDSEPNILTWNSEGLSINYIDPNDNKSHRYYPDFLVQLIDKNKKIKNILIEIKPHKETCEPKKPKKITKSYVQALELYHKNLAKWNAAEKFCKKNDIEFKIITEKNLGI